MSVSNQESCVATHFAEAEALSLARLTRHKSQYMFIEDLLDAQNIGMGPLGSLAPSCWHDWLANRSETNHYGCLPARHRYYAWHAQRAFDGIQAIALCQGRCLLPPLWLLHPAAQCAEPWMFRALPDRYLSRKVHVALDHASLAASHAKTPGRERTRPRRVHSPMSYLPRSWASPPRALRHPLDQPEPLKDGDRRMSYSAIQDRLLPFESRLFASSSCEDLAKGSPHHRFRLSAAWHGLDLRPWPLWPGTKMPADIVVTAQKTDNINECWLVLWVLGCWNAGKDQCYVEAVCGELLASPVVGSEPLGECACCPHVPREVADNAIPMCAIAMLLCIENAAGGRGGSSSRSMDSPSHRKMVRS